MNIDERDIERGALHDILPKFHPNSISYLGELNDYRMYAEVWSNKRSKVGAKRSESGHVGYLKTLEFGEREQKRKSDKIRFDYFVVADSLNYKVTRDVYGEQKAYIQMGGVQTNTIFSNIIKTKAQSLHSDSDFHSEGYLPGIIELDLEKLGLSRNDEHNKYYFEISTNSSGISNQYQKMLLSQALGRHDIFEKLQLLHKVGRKRIRCLFENHEYVIKNIGTSNAIPRLCVAWPFHETLVFDFAGIPEDYEDACLLGTSIATKEKIVKAPKVKPKDTGWHGGPQIDSYA